MAVPAGSDPRACLCPWLSCSGRGAAHRVLRRVIGIECLMMGPSALVALARSRHDVLVLDSLLDIFRLRQYFNIAVRARQVERGLRDDAGFLDLVRRSMVSLPFDRHRAVDTHPFAGTRPHVLHALDNQRIAVMATGGSGALASVVGVARAFEESGVSPAVLSLCSGSALFGFPIAAGISASDAAAFTISLRPSDYVDIDWRRLAMLVPSGARGFGGLLRGERLEQTYRDLLGDMRLGDMPIPAYAPIWNVEENRVAYIGPRTYPEMTVARAVRMAVALPLFFDPVRLDGESWCDGGIVDIFPVHPVLDIEAPCDLVVAVNGFYPPGFVGEDVSGWRDRQFSIIDIASQVRTSQQAQLARENLARLEATLEVHMIEPVSYEMVMGLGFYRQFLTTEDWPAFMRTGRQDALRALRRATKARADRPTLAGMPPKAMGRVGS
jgi:NTE family protein